MFVNVFLRRFLPFCLAAACGLAVVSLINDQPQPSPTPGINTKDSVRRFDSLTGTTEIIHVNRGTPKNFGSGSSGGDDSRYDSRHRLWTRTGTNKVNLFSKPKAEYTDAARENNVEGTVRLKVVLLASGRVGSITPVTELPDGLTEQAIAAARQIRFEPKTIDGVPVSTIVTIEYSFSIY